jgi:hypothetical protein
MEQGKPVAGHADWPLFYMNDFSRLGLVVVQLAQAVAVLEASGYRMSEDGRAVQFDHGEQLAGVFAALSAQQVKYEVTDLISCVYQG